MITCLLHSTKRYGLLALSLAVTVGISACDADKPVSGNGNSNDPAGFFDLVQNGTPGRTVLTLDPTTVRGFLGVSVSRSLDSRWGSNIHMTSLNAVTGGADGNPLAIASASANGAALSQLGTSNHIFGNDAPQAAIVAGGNVNWSVTLVNGVSFNDFIQVPVEPRINNLIEYASYKKGQGLNIQWNGGGDPNAEAIISFAVDPTITREEGGDVSRINRTANPTLVYTETTNDDGEFTIPAEDLAGFPDNVYGHLTVTTFNYQTKTRSDGELYGLIARSQYGVVIKLTP